MLLVVAKVLSVVFSVLVISKSYLSYKARRESLVMTVFWSATWVLIILIAAFPALTDKILGISKHSGGTGTLLGIGLIFLYFVIYRVYVKADRIEKQLSKVVREMALKTYDLKSRPKKKEHSKEQ